MQRKHEWRTPPLDANKHKLDNNAAQFGEEPGVVKTTLFVNFVLRRLKVGILDLKMGTIADHRRCAV